MFLIQYPAIPRKIDITSKRLNDYRFRLYVMRFNRDKNSYTISDLWQNKKKTHFKNNDDWGRENFSDRKIFEWISQRTLNYHVSLIGAQCFNHIFRSCPTDYINSTIETVSNKRRTFSIVSVDQSKYYSYQTSRETSKLFVTQWW